MDMNIKAKSLRMIAYNCSFLVSSELMKTSPDEFLFNNFKKFREEPIFTEF